ncbi:MAG: flagellar export chaperone FliS [Acidimicrobiales bacterium]
MRNDPDPYLVQQVATASKAMLTSMLFNAAVANTQRAIVQLDDGRPQPARRFLIRAQEIVLELRTSLDHDAGGEIAANLERIYDFVYRQLIAASVHGDVRAAHDAERILADLRDTWQAACVEGLVTT